MGDATHPGKRLREMLEERGWTQDELAHVTGRARQTISGIVAGRTNVTPEMAVTLGAAFGNDPAEWLRWAAEYDLSITETNATDVEKRAQLYRLAPVREMIKRGWITETNSDDGLERELSAFFGGSLSAAFPIAARRTTTLDSLNAAEKAWCFRARQLAQSILAKEFDPHNLDAAEQRLRKAAAYAKDADRVSLILSEAGIRFIVIEPLPGAKIDGASFWLDARSPVIALSLRHDRLDAFWYTLFHEWAHIKNGDALSVDVNFLIDKDGGIAIALAEEEQERRANEKASNILVPHAELESFIARLAPYYSRERIVQFAHKMKIHPAVIVGQLQHRQEIGYHALREFLVKVRTFVVQTALTDGWGHMAPRLVIGD